MEKKRGRGRPKKGEEKIDPFQPAKVGRPYVLEPDERTLSVIRGMRNVQCTAEEIAAAMSVSLSAFAAFRKRCPEAEEAFRHGEALGKVSLRRTQFRLAQKQGSVAIFLGKQYLGQADKIDTKHTGDIGINIDDEDADM